MAPPNATSSMTLIGTPAINMPATPAILQGAPPWAMQTPEASPAIWERAPPGNISHEDNTRSAPGLTKELLRRVCEPYFEQMLESLLMTLQNPHVMPAGGPIKETEAFGCLKPTPDIDSEDDSPEESGGLGAFSSVFVDRPQARPFCLPVSQSGAPNLDMRMRPQSGMTLERGDLEKQVNAALEGQEKQVTVMVCRHWKSKGWCRLGDECKFAHPEHKCGVGAPAAKGAANSGAAKNGRGDDSPAGENAADASKKARKRGGRSKGQDGKASPEQPAKPVGVSLFNLLPA